MTFIDSPNVRATKRGSCDNDAAFASKGERKEEKQEERKETNDVQMFHDSA